MDAGGEQTLRFGYGLPEESLDEYTLTISSVLADDMPWAEKGYETGFDQFLLPIKRKNALANAFYREKLYTSTKMLYYFHMFYNVFLYYWKQ